MTHRTLYDQIGRTYNTTRRADPYIVSRLLVLLNPQPNATYLDLACGSGNYTHALAAQGLHLTGIDQSPTMIAAAKQKTSSITWHIANAESLPLPSAAFDGALCTLAIHHFTNLTQAFKEIHRVLRTGNFVLFTTTHQQMQSCWLREYFPDAIAKSIQQMPDLPQVKSALQSAGFGCPEIETYDIQPDLQDLFLYSGKHRPEIYLNPQVRDGISTFSLLASPSEIEEGCKKLAQDIATHRIKDVIASYASPHGDYSFITAKRH